MSSSACSAQPPGSAASAATTPPPCSSWPSWPCCRRPAFALAELAELAADPATARVRWPTLAQAKLAELDAQIRQATAARRLLAHALACNCPHPGQCELVQSAGARRAAQQPIRQPRRVAS